MPGESDYPAKIDTLPTTVGGKTRSRTGNPVPEGTPSHHSQNHNNANAAILALEETLGVNPQGPEEDVAARLDAIEEGDDAAVAGEKAERKAADEGLATAIGAETAARETAVALEKSNREGDVNTEEARAIAAEALKASKAELGTETSGREGADATEKTAREAADAAEQARAEAAEALKLAKASNLSDLGSAPTARTNLGLGTAATEPKTAFDAFGAAAAEETRAKGVEATKADLVGGVLKGSEVPTTVVSDSRGTAAGDLLIFDGASFVKLPRGEPGERLVVRSDGTVAWEQPPTISVEAWGAVTTEDATKVFQEVSEKINKRGGGTATVGPKEYMVDGLLLENFVKWQGCPGTVIKAKEGSANPGMIMMKKGVVELGGLDNFTFKTNAANTEQDIFYLFAQEATGGLNRYYFSNLIVGTALFPGQRNCMWFRGSFNITSPHQFINFRNVAMYRATTGAQALTSRGLKCTGQCAKFGFDESFQINGAPSGTHAGTNIELGREFLPVSTLTAEAAKGATTLTLASVEGLEAGKIISVGDGAFNEACEIEGIAGKVVTVKTALKFSHPNGYVVKALSGTVAAPATATPTEFAFHGGAIQNAHLQVLVDNCKLINFFGTDFENHQKVMRVGLSAKDASRDVNIKDDANFTGCSEATAFFGTGTVTAGSAVITGTTKTWVVGDVIAGPGIPPGATVTVVEGTTITISANVEANGVEGANSISLWKSNGEGYVATYEGASTGKVEGFANGIFDNYVLVPVTGTSGASVRVNIDLAGTTKTKVSSGVTLVTTTAESLTINHAKEVVVTDATKSLKTVNGYHSTGEMFIYRATVNATKIIKGGNISLPGGTTVELAAGECAFLLRTDYGPLSWVLVSKGL